MFIKKLQLTFALLCCVPLFSMAMPPHFPDLIEGGNRWLITGYDDSDAAHTQWGTQGICFYHAGTQGTHEHYVWVSDTFPDWNGRATQEGDQVVLHGDYAGDVGHDSVSFEIVTSTPNNEAYGHWTEWREDGDLGATIGFLNTKMVRVGSCAITSASDAIEAAVNVEHRLNARGEVVISPMGFSERDIIKKSKKNK